MRGGVPVNKDVIDALKKVVASMQHNDEYPQLQKSLEELIHVSENADASTANAYSSTVNAVPPTVNAAGTAGGSGSRKHKMRKIKNQYTSK